MPSCLIALHICYFQKNHEKADIFKLNEEEDLTHYGQSLSEIEKFEDPVGSDIEDDRENWKIDGKWNLSGES